MKEKLLIISKNQFGYLTDVYKWSEHLNDLYDISVICFDQGLPKMSIDGVSVKYCSRKMPRSLRGAIFIIWSIITCLKHNGKIIVVYFEKCDLIKKICKRKRIHLDIRTLSVSPSEDERKRYDSVLKKTCGIYNSVSIISRGLQSKIGLAKAEILPLGADEISTCRHDFDFLRLLYVGTLSQRRIEDTIYGLNIFLRRHPGISIKYDIVGDGNGNELQLLQTLISEYNLGSYIVLHGRVPYDKVKTYFDRANIGVSYVPVTEYFNYQPPTKTYEYVLSGLYCIATNTHENAQLIKDGINGQLICDNPISFANALEDMTRKISEISQDDVKNSLISYSWKSIVSEHLIPILNNL